MKVKCERSLDTIDTKITMDFLHDTPKLFTDSIATQHKFGNYHRIWTIEDFLSVEECNEIITSCENIGFKSLDESYDKNYRDSERIIAFDENNYLMETMEKRLYNDKFYDRLQHKNIMPYGFNSRNFEWSNNSINKCLRINKYKPNSLGFDWHRDAAFTDSEDVKSNLTLLVYLTDNIDGQLKFMAPKTDIIHEGYTTIEELNILKNLECDTFELLPKVGMAVLFDQRFLHKAMPNTEIKYVLRSDLITYGTKINDDETIMESKIKDLARKLFRQAQYFELSNNNQQAKVLYEICISLRQTPDKIGKYPKHLELLLQQMPMNKNILNDIFTIELLSRSGSEYKFKYSNVESLVDIHNSIKIAGAYTTLSSIRALDGNCIKLQDEFMMKLLNKIKLKEKIIDITLDDKLDDIIIKKPANFKKYFEKRIGVKFPINEVDTLVSHESNFEKCFNKYLKLKYNLDDLSVELATEFDENHTGLIIKCSGRDITFSDTDDIKIYEDANLSLELDNFQMILKPKLEQEDNKLSGTIKIKTLSSPFNHASYNCNESSSENEILTSENIEEFIHIEIKMDYNVDLITHIMEISFIPQVTM